MATKKQKRVEMEQKRLREAEETRRSGLRAQEKDRQQRAARAKALEAKAAEEAKRQNKVLADAKMAGMAGITHSVDA